MPGPILEAGGDESRAGALRPAPGAGDLPSGRPSCSPAGGPRRRRRASSPACPRRPRPARRRRLLTPDGPRRSGCPCCPRWSSPPGVQALERAGGALGHRDLRPPPAAGNQLEPAEARPCAACTASTRWSWRCGWTPPCWAGCRLELQGVTYDKSVAGRLGRPGPDAGRGESAVNARPEEIVSLLREEIEGYDNKTRRTEEGTVLEVGDGIATIYGLDRAVYGELVEFDTGVRGMVMDLSRDTVGCVLLGAGDRPAGGQHRAPHRPARRACPVGDANAGPGGGRPGPSHRRSGPHPTPPRPAPSSTRPAASSPGSR